MSKEKQIFSPVLQEALQKAPGFGENAVRALISWKGEPIWADIVPASGEITPESLQIVNNELNWLWENFQLVKDQFGEGSELLQEKNENLFEGETTFTAEEFQEQMILEAIQLNLDGSQVTSLQVWYDDGELFGGASVLIEMKGRKLTGIEIRD